MTDPKRGLYYVHEDEPLVGWRNNLIINLFGDEENFLRSPIKKYIWPTRLNSEGIYNYNYYNYDNYYIQVKTIH
jgi:hypothetical protein